MRRLIAIPSLLLALALPASAQARDSYCSPTGDYCTSVTKKADAHLLRLATFSFRGRVRVCVEPPRGSGTCKRFLIRKGKAGIYVSSVRWETHFPDRGAGAYRVRWQKFRSTLGPALTFRP